MSNPTSKSEAIPADVAAPGPRAAPWSPPAARSTPVRWQGRTSRIGQGNNAFVFPGIGPGGAGLGGARGHATGCSRPPRARWPRGDAPRTWPAGSLFPRVRELPARDGRASPRPSWRTARDDGVGRPMADDAIPRPWRRRCGSRPTCRSWPAPDGRAPGAGHRLKRRRRVQVGVALPCGTSRRSDVGPLEAPGGEKRRARRSRRRARARAGARRPRDLREAQERERRGAERRRPLDAEQRAGPHRVDRVDEHRRRSARATRPDGSSEASAERGDVEQHDRARTRRPARARARARAGRCCRRRARAAMPRKIAVRTTEPAASRGHEAREALVARPARR